MFPFLVPNLLLGAALDEITRLLSLGRHLEKCI
jgi:hypothetical protein